MYPEATTGMQACPDAVSPAAKAVHEAWLCCHCCIACKHHDCSMFVGINMTPVNFECVKPNRQSDKQGEQMPYRYAETQQHKLRVLCSMHPYAFTQELHRRRSDLTFHQPNCRPSLHRRWCCSSTQPTADLRLHEQEPIQQPAVTAVRPTHRLSSYTIYSSYAICYFTVPRILRQQHTA